MTNSATSTAMNRPTRLLGVLGGMGPLTQEAKLIEDFVEWFRNLQYLQTAAASIRRSSATGFS